MKYELVLNAEIRQVESYGGSLQVRESVELLADSFIELCSILAEFHKLAEHLAKQPKR